MARRHDGLDWTPAMIDSLRAYWASGMVVTQIAAVMAREFREPFTKNALMGKVHRLRLPKRGRPKRYKNSSPELAAQQASARAPRLPKMARARVVESSLNSPMPAKVAAPKVEPVAGIGILSEAMKTSHCQWPLWDGDLPPLDQRRHCGCAVAAGRPYCAAHAARAYVKIKPRPEGMVLAFHDPASEALRAKFAARVRA